MSKILVAYFSATGTTARVAHEVARAAAADLFEIKPEQPYTAADLNWHDKTSRTTIECADPAARPAIADKVADMAQYDVVLIGFPIWWYKAPMIIETFLQAYDFAGRKIAVFATSGGSPMGKTEEILQKICPAADWLGGVRIDARAEPSYIKNWVAQLGI